MAIKERKQITGTTAQIQAYAGHEGQIVWDKEKKTFVGMSGTAGTNYPLAQQAYVDEGLEGKEDKGVCLPLTGGSLTGVLFLKGGGHLNQDKGASSGYGYLALSTKDEAGSPGSCTLYFANPESRDKGSMILRYTDEQGTNHDLSMQGATDEFYWNKRAVETISEFGGNYIRYSNGLQIVFDFVNIPSSGLKTYNFPVPFSSSVSIATAQNQNNHVNALFNVGLTQIQLASSWTSNENNACWILAIGRWK